MSISGTHYQERAHIFCGIDGPRNDHLAMGGLGLSGETIEFLELAITGGHLAEMVKKTIYHSIPTDIDKYASELGDILWYVAEVCTALGIDMSDLMDYNLAKLRDRHDGNHARPPGETKKPTLSYLAWLSNS